MKRAQLDLEVYGRVQGILFRKDIERFAVELGLKGFVKNRDDGGVEISVQGKKKALEEFASWVQSSPGWSKISGMNCKWNGVGKAYQDFHVVKEDSFLVDKTKAVLNLGKALLTSDKGKVPKHVVIIPDGNRRWAKSRGLDAFYGHHHAGNGQNINELFRETKRLGIEYISFWGFSTENWKREEKEIKEIFDLILNNLSALKKNAHKEGIRFRHIGRRDRLPKKLVSELKKLERETEKYDSLNVQLCLDYGGRDEIVRAVNKMLKDKVGKVGEKEFASYLDTRGIPDPDLVIRTSGERRISGLMPFQSIYAELYFTDVRFPEFGPRDLRAAVSEFRNRTRRFGGDSK